MTRDEYLRDVGYWLRDLPWSTRRDLMSELRGHLDELPADMDFRAQLGPPETYAHDLRNPRTYTIIDGADTSRILKSQGLLPVSPSH